MIRSLELLCAAGLLLAGGCRNRSSSSDNTSGIARSEASTDADRAKDNASSGASPAEGVDTIVATYESLNIAIQTFYTAAGRVPKDIDELVHLELIPQAPTTPPGKKFVIDPVKRQVKLVSN